MWICRALFYQTQLFSNPSKTNCTLLFALILPYTVQIPNVRVNQHCYSHSFYKHTLTPPTKIDYLSNSFAGAVLFFPFRCTVY